MRVRRKDGTFTSAGAAKTNFRHGGYRTPEYLAFQNAKRRCNDERLKNYADYGGRGIKFLFKSFKPFFAELGKRPAGMVLDRINNDGNYEPGNVRWTTRSEAQKNRRMTKRRLRACRKNFALASEIRWGKKVFRSQQLDRVGVTLKPKTRA